MFVAAFLLQILQLYLSIDAFTHMCHHIIFKQEIKLLFCACPFVKGQQRGFIFNTKTCQ